MNWNRIYGLRDYLRSSLWFVPFIAILVELVATRLVHWLDAWLGWKLMGFTVPGAQALFQAVVSATLAFMVFTFASLLVAIQIASAQLTPRIIATTLLRNDVVKYTVGLFVFALFFALSAQNRINKDVYQLVTFLAALFGVFSFAAFFYLIDYASRLLRPVSILASVGNSGLEVIEQVYAVSALGPDITKSESLRPGESVRVIEHQGRSAIVLAVNLELLAAEAERSNGVIEFVPQVGDFVSLNDPLFNLYGGARSIDKAMLHSAVAFGTERSMEQDPTFAFRIVADIALKALSPAINDPTTAVLAIDQLHRMLRAVGKHHLRAEGISDKTGTLRLIIRTPNWEDFVHLAFSETRSCGSHNLQIVRRLRAMILNLLQILPLHRHAALNEQLSLLDREIAKNFTYPEELALAQIPDSQGLGGHSGTRGAA
jgi:uncharacterized membrane protein